MRQNDSPAINAGSNDLATDTDFDQPGTPFARVVLGRVDVGAFEAPSDATIGNDNIITVTINTDGLKDGDYSAGNLSLREAILLANANPGADSARLVVNSRRRFGPGYSHGSKQSPLSSSRNVCINDR